VLVERDHAELAGAVPEDYHGRVGAVMFNLGYLPGGDKSLTTRRASTVQAVRAALDLLRAGGVMTVIAYTGHPGGAREADAVADALSQLPPNEYEVRAVDARSGARYPPRLFVVQNIVTMDNGFS
jgi:hypothetical protein